MFNKQRIISHIVLWSLIIAGAFSAFIFFPAKMAFNIGIERWFLIVPLAAFFVYHLSSAIYQHFKFYPISQKEIMAIKKGVYGKFAHPTCTTLTILGWIIFLYYPETRIFFSMAWMTFLVFFWIRLEESFFMGKGRRIIRRKPEPA